MCGFGKRKTLELLLSDGPSLAYDCASEYRTEGLVVIPSRVDDEDLTKMGFGTELI